MAKGMAPRARLSLEPRKRMRKPLERLGGGAASPLGWPTSLPPSSGRNTRVSRPCSCARHTSRGQRASADVRTGPQSAGKYTVPLTAASCAPQPRRCHCCASAAAPCQLPTLNRERESPASVSSLNQLWELGCLSAAQPTNLLPTIHALREHEECLCRRVVRPPAVPVPAASQCRRISRLTAPPVSPHGGAGGHAGGEPDDDVGHDAQAGGG